MSSENYKGKLQEKFPTNNISYHTWRVGGSDHEPLWQSTVSLDVMSYTSPSTGQSSKVKAEQAAAEKALEDICIGSSDTNFKGKLQEKFPNVEINYHTVQIVGQPNQQPLWYSTVMLRINGISYQYDSSLPYKSSKIQAEQAAAQKALDSIKPKVEEEDETYDQKDIELVQTQSNCTRAQAIRALTGNRGDVVEAIMSLMV